MMRTEVKTIKTLQPCNIPNAISTLYCYSTTEIVSTSSKCDAVWHLCRQEELVRHIQSLVPFLNLSRDAMQSLLVITNASLNLVL